MLQEASLQHHCSLESQQKRGQEQNRGMAGRAGIRRDSQESWKTKKNRERQRERKKKQSRDLTTNVLQISYNLFKLPKHKQFLFVFWRGPHAPFVSSPGFQVVVAWEHQCLYGICCNQLHRTSGCTWCYLSSQQEETFSIPCWLVELGSG